MGVTVDVLNGRPGHRRFFPAITGKTMIDAVHASHPTWVHQAQYRSGAGEFIALTVQIVKAWILLQKIVIGHVVPGSFGRV